MPKKKQEPKKKKELSMREYYTMSKIAFIVWNLAILCFILAMLFAFYFIFNPEFTVALVSIACLLVAVILTALAIKNYKILELGKSDVNIVNHILHKGKH